MRKLLFVIPFIFFACNSENKRNVNIYIKKQKTNDYDGVAMFHVRFQDGTKGIAKDRFAPLKESIFKEKDTVSINPHGFIDIPTSISDSKINTSKKAIIVKSL